MIKQTLTELLWKLIMDKKQIIEQLKKFPTDETKAIWLLSQVEQLEEQFETANDIIQDKCEKLISEFFSETLDLPKKIKKYAQIGMRYSGFINRLKTRVAIDEMVVDEEIKELFQMAKAEIQSLRREKSAILRDTAQTRKDIKNFKIQLYANEQIDLLKTENQKRKAKQLVEGANSKNKIDCTLREIRKNAKHENRI